MQQGSPNYGVDMTYPHNPAYRKLTPRFLLVRQRADKGSTTSGSPQTEYYNKYYEDSADYLASARESVALRSAAVVGFSEAA
jgi:hypothetical protein